MASTTTPSSRILKTKTLLFHPVEKTKMTSFQEIAPPHHHHHHRRVEEENVRMEGRGTITHLKQPTMEKRNESDEWIGDGRRRNVNLQRRRR
ncbi:hypothetical protein L6452_35601 [Arctium lappa]|uniref:Uncharacterized protein n=1 Tax=Arctium lappa TaxID=4217 RepID=A0ACB8Y697_ARCLA|nr:hypothetical protein L6452_35601 [Arctium lappa]